MTSPSCWLASLLRRPHECRQRLVPTTTSRQRHGCPEASVYVSVKRSYQHVPSPWVPAEAMGTGSPSDQMGGGVPGKPGSTGPEHCFAGRPGCDPPLFSSTVRWPPAGAAATPSDPGWVSLREGSRITPQTTHQSCSLSRTNSWFNRLLKTRALNVKNTKSVTARKRRVMQMSPVPRFTLLPIQDFQPLE